MQYRQLGMSDIRVSRICLGSMTWGQQNNAEDALRQLDYALAHGVNFIDTAEVYPSPIKSELCGATESFIGAWLSSRKSRKEVVLASKVAGPEDFLLRPHLHEGRTRLDRQSIIEACDASLKRLRTDYIDLYQIHWPERSVNIFGQMDYIHDSKEDPLPLEETLGAMGELVEQGKVRMIGLSNDTPWGVMRCLSLAEKHGFPRIVSVQNPYCLLNRLYDIGLSEISMRENIGLFSYSPLANGALSGKYLGGKKPAGARMTLWDRYYQRYATPKAAKAIESYHKIAKKYNLDMAKMALAFVNGRDFLVSNIIGATNLDQLKDNIASDDMSLSQDVLDEIERIHQENPNPAP